MPFTTSRQTMQSAAVATGNGTPIATLGYSRLVMQTIGITTATITYEATVDGSNWVAIACSPVGGGAAATTSTADAIVFVACGGYGLIRARISAYTSGTITTTGIVSEY